ncbi:PLD nuclease N-terminal domain-containing protein [Planobispora longispora]|uniref:Cardiolipin synthase N-terminal domain-containing protein n=1 Tax=Planobispora longispora TaxID=28887 RepID=A0A8J3W7X5_9ACTN|nr:PLD nuclease N-terminal domain-containing protein [Planobispora longispora]GIH78256.1 hypothetical protein Plo01_46850 [Planobispora longispora]
MNRRSMGRSARRTRRRRWADLPPRRRGAILTLAVIELLLTSAAAVDMRIRPQSDVRGRKALWWPAIFIQPVGPILYLLLGRRPGCADTARSRPAPGPSPAEQHAVTRYP